MLVPFRTAPTCLSPEYWNLCGVVSAVVTGVSWLVLILLLLQRRSRSTSKQFVSKIVGSVLRSVRRRAMIFTELGLKLMLYGGIVPLFFISSHWKPLRHAFHISYTTAISVFGQSVPGNDLGSFCCSGKERI